MTVHANQVLSLLDSIVAISMSVYRLLVTNSLFAQIFLVLTNANANQDILVMEFNVMMSMNVMIVLVKTLNASIITDHLSALAIQVAFHCSNSHF